MLSPTDEAGYMIAKTYSTAIRALQTGGGPYWKLTGELKDRIVDGQNGMVIDDYGVAGWTEAFAEV